jgi:hypothetical protein
MINRLCRFVLVLLTFLASLPSLARGQQQAEPPPVADPAPMPQSVEPPRPAPPPGGNVEPAEPFSSGGRGGGVFAGPWSGLDLLKADYRGAWFAPERVSGQPTNLSYVQQSLNLTVPFWQDERNQWFGSVGVRSQISHTGAVLPDTGQPFPNELWNVHLGTGFRHLFDSGWVAGANVSVGSASDQPFHSIDEISVGVNAFLRIPQGERNAWLFSLSYSTNSELWFPIPGVAYQWQPTDNFQANIGLPFQLWYRPLDDLTLDFSYVLVRTVHARATYRLAPAVRVYTAFDWGNESWFLADRTDSRERFFYYDMRLTGGVKVNFARAASLDVFAGYDFDRFYFEGRSFQDNQNNRIDVGDGPFAGLQFQVRW